MPDCSFKIYEKPSKFSKSYKDYVIFELSYRISSWKRKSSPNRYFPFIWGPAQAESLRQTNCRKSHDTVPLTLKICISLCTFVVLFTLSNNISLSDGPQNDPFLLISTRHIQSGKRKENFLARKENKSSLIYVQCKLRSRFVIKRKNQRKRKITVCTSI